MTTKSIHNLRDLPWIDDEQLTDLKEHQWPPIRLPSLEIVLEQAQLTLSKARNVLRANEWTHDASFLQQRDVREFLQTFMRACHLLKAHELHTDVYCGWMLANGQVCGSLMDIEADSNRAYYRCQQYPIAHRTAV